MKKHNAKNERIKWEYLRFLEDAKRMKRESVDQAAAAIADFEASTNWKDFALFHLEQARKFKRDLDSRTVAETGRPLAVATKVSKLRHVKTFFQWLAGIPGYKRRLNYSEAEYFSPSYNEGRIAGARRDTPVPSLEQIRHVLATMPTATVIERRNRALIAFAILTAARDAALASFSLKHVDIERRTVFQDAREVRTKNRKTFTTWFYPVGADIEVIVTDWLAELETKHHFGPDDPLFPATAMGLDANRQFHAVGIARQHWSDAGPIRRIFKEAFEGAGLSNFNPHSFRKTIWKLGESVCRIGEEEKAWSLNLGHDHVRTSRESYGPMTADQQEAVLRRVAAKVHGHGERKFDPETLALVMEILQNAKDSRRID